MVGKVEDLRKEMKLDDSIPDNYTDIKYDYMSELNITYKSLCFLCYTYKVFYLCMYVQYIVPTLGKVD